MSFGTFTFNTTQSITKNIKSTAISNLNDGLLFWYQLRLHCYGIT